jgi:transposase
MEYRPKRKERGEFLPEDRSAIFHLSEAGISQSKIANKFRCTRKTIYNTLKRYSTCKERNICQTSGS